MGIHLFSCVSTEADVALAGFQSSMKEFRGWLGYRERLEFLQKLESLARTYPRMLRYPS